MALVNMSVVEQRYRAVLAVERGEPRIVVASGYGVSRQTLHTWLSRYSRDGLAGLSDRSHRPDFCPHQAAAEVETAVCELRREHPRWGPRRLVHELTRTGALAVVPSVSTVHRILRRHGLITPRRRRRRREDYLRWQRAEPMQLWQLDIVGGILLTDGTEAKIVTGLDDCSRFCVIATWWRGPPGGRCAWPSPPRCAATASPTRSCCGFVITELSVMEQRYQAVLEVEAWPPVGSRSPTGPGSPAKRSTGGCPLPSRPLVSPDCASSHATAALFPSPLGDRGSSPLNAIVTTIAATTSISNAIHRTWTAVSLAMVIFWTGRRCRPDRPRGACRGLRRLGLLMVLSEAS
jgi:transposase